MGFYDLPKEERAKLVQTIERDVALSLKTGYLELIKTYATDSDTYIRKNKYVILGRFYNNHPAMRKIILETIRVLFHDGNERIRQTMVYPSGEIGKTDTECVQEIMEQALKDQHHSVRNAVIGALKQMGEKNPQPTLKFARKFLYHSDPKIRSKIFHGIELRGRTHPEDILPPLEEFLP